MSILKRILLSLINECRILVDIIYIPKIRKLLTIVLSLLLFLRLLELLFVNSSATVANLTISSKNNYLQEVRHRIKEAERLVIKKRDEFARDPQIVSAVQSKDEKRIIETVYAKDSLLQSEISSKGGFGKETYITFALYDSLSNLIGWNSGATFIEDIQTVFHPPFSVSNLVKGSFFEEGPTKQYITAFHKLFNDKDVFLGYIVFKTFLCDAELSVNSLNTQSPDDVFTDFENKEHVYVRLASGTDKYNNDDEPLTNGTVLLEEGGPFSTINFFISVPVSEIESENQWNALSAFRDLLSILVCSIVLFSFYYSIYNKKRNTYYSHKSLIKQTLLIFCCSILVRFLLYLVDAGRSLFPHTLTLQTDFAYQSIPFFSDPLELLLSSYIISACCISIFILFTTNVLTSISFRKSVPFVTSCILIGNVAVLIVLSLFMNWFVDIVTTNSSFDLTTGFKIFTPSKYFIPLASLFIVTFAVVTVSFSFCFVASTLLSEINLSRARVRLYLCALFITTVILIITFGGKISNIGTYTLCISWILAFASTVRFPVTPFGFTLTRSPIIALTLATVVCCILAPTIKQSNQNKLKQSLEQSVLSKASFQFTTASLLLNESINSNRSFFAHDTIHNPARLPLYLIREQERLQKEIHGVSVSLYTSLDTNSNGIADSISEKTNPVNDQIFTASIPFYVRGQYLDASTTITPHTLHAVLTNDLLSIGIEDPHIFTLIYTNDKIERAAHTELTIPTTLADDIMRDAGKGSWIATVIDGKDVLLFVKSIYTISSSIPEKILVGGLLEYTFHDVLVFAVRYATLGLAMTALCLLILLATTNKLSLTRFTLRFRERIFLIIFSIALVPLIFVSNITRTIIESRDSENQKRAIINDAQKTASIMQPLVSDSSAVLRIPYVLKDISRTLDHRIDVFDANGILIASTVPNLYSAFLLPRFLSLDVLYDIRISEQTSTYYEQTNDFERTITSFQTIYDPSFTKLLAVVALTKVENITRRESDIAATTSLIYGTFSLVALTLLILGSYVSYRVASPLQDMIRATEKVASGDFDTRLHFERKDEIGDLTTAFNKMITELESSRNKVAQSEREGAWKEMARQVAHEIKNPLTPMKLSVQHVQHAHDVKDTNFSAVFSRVMKTLSEQIDVLTRIATEFSRFGEMPRRRYGFVSLKQVVESALALFDSERAHIRFVSDIHDDKSLIYADEEEFRRTLVNLLRNAVQSMEGWGVIVVSSNESNGIIHLSIKDTGTGMSEETLQKAFDPNFSTKTSGMGLGLAIVKRTITDMSGTIRVESTIGKGTTFLIDLPSRES